MHSTGSLKEDYFNSVANTYKLQGGKFRAEDLREEILENLEKIMLGIKFVQNSEDVPTSDDIGVKPWVPSQCSVKQIAHFNHNARVIYINENIFNE